jgi:hypothetical protein
MDSCIPKEEVKTAGILGILPLLQWEKYVAYNLKKIK